MTDDIVLILSNYVTEVVVVVATAEEVATEGAEAVVDQTLGVAAEVEGAPLRVRREAQDTPTNPLHTTPGLGHLTEVSKILLKPENTEHHNIALIL